MNNNNNNNNKVNNMIKDGHHLNSKYWQNFKNSLGPLTPKLNNILVGMILGDAHLAHKDRFPFIKFEQGYLQKDFIFHLYEEFKDYVFTEPQTRFELYGVRKGLPKSYYFKTFSHSVFKPMTNLFLKDNVKVIKPALKDHLSDIGLAYWIMCDGSLDKNLKSMILHTQSYSREENFLLASMINDKFGLNTTVIPHKKKYFVISIPSSNYLTLRN
jgi:hypothetical protein